MSELNYIIQPGQIQLTRISPILSFSPLFYSDWSDIFLSPKNSETRLISIESQPKKIVVVVVVVIGVVVVVVHVVIVVIPVVDPRNLPLKLG